MLKTSRVVLVVGLAFAGSLPAQSQQPSPAPPKTAQKPQPQASKHEDSASEAHHVAAESASTRRPISAAPTHPETAEDSEQRRDYTSAEWWLVYVTGGLVVMTTVLAIYTANLWSATKELAAEAKATADRQAREVRESLDIGERTVGAMERNAERRLRAYLSRSGTPEWKRVRHISGGYVFSVQVPIKNSGATPAYNVVAQGRAFLRPSPLPDSTDLTLDLRPTNGRPLGPGQELEITYRSDALSETEETIMHSPGWGLFIVGSVSYRDAFDHQRRLLFCEEIEWLKVGIATRAADRHNEAD